MKINIPKVIAIENMGSYAKELMGKELHCWVNPPLMVLSAYSQILTSLYEESFLKSITKEKKSEGKKKLEVLQEEFKELLDHKRETPIERMDVKKLEWFVQVFSQGPEETHWTLEELIQLEETDPSFLAWMIKTYWKNRQEHFNNKKKS